MAQGTVPGTLLFLLFVNDICKIVVSLTRLFADDCLLYNKVYNQGNEDRLHNDLYKLEKWGQTWKTTFNVTKSNQKYVYWLNGEDQDYFGQHTYLRWENKVKGVANKANRLLGFIKRNIHMCPHKWTIQM